MIDRIIFTCGGTAGHVNPAIAVAQELQRRNPQVELLFVGAHRGLERELIAKAGYAFEAVNISSFHRSLKPREIRHNLISLGNLIRAPREAKAILKRFQPQMVIGTGGYACYPMVKAAFQAGLPTLIHESNLVPGLTTKMLVPYASRVLVGFEACRSGYPDSAQVVVTGTPVRGDFFAMTKAQAKQALGLDENRRLIVSFWGSLGARGMNEQMAQMLALEAAHQPFDHIHATGQSSYDGFLSQVEALGVDLEAAPALQVKPYIHNMATVMAAADLVICRAGASTLSELTALGIPAILVPSPYVTNNHQEKNARALEAGSVVLTEAESTPKGCFKPPAKYYMMTKPMPTWRRPWQPWGPETQQS
ncbi:UDP-N-acetylglucosamine--N-acetylmuramyl-(pentapeptide) pyrophosphoryl-undecaprenol N-acetylglucosamine transferase [Bengtsoniella intestinalis]|uniref:UDP-N-acetylglucosamine--N-acetylmuramyl- (pentapeptide) pyrophosphoryl-undecaprenol N-acetylglucosamine transferase n=1 Tax=Bengtsoniella intestinalis TaxID=3073143 RepID=UPI00391EF46B